MAFGMTRLHSADLLRRLFLVAFTVGALLISLLAMHFMAGSHVSASGSPSGVAVNSAPPHAAQNIAADPSAAMAVTETLTMVAATVVGGVVPVCDASNLSCAATVAVCALLLVIGSMVLLMALPRRSHPMAVRIGRSGRRLPQLPSPLPPPSLTVLCVSRT